MSAPTTTPPAAASPVVPPDDGASVAETLDTIRDGLAAIIRHVNLMNAVMLELADRYPPVASALRRAAIRARDGEQ